MRLLKILGNSLHRRLLSSSSILVGCCNELWQTNRQWDDNCEWVEPDCGSDIWVNNEIWTNECIWPGSDGFPYILPFEVG